MDGRVLTAAFDPRFLQQNTTNYQDVSEVASAASDNASYSPQEAAQIEARLKALGYID
jgi:hypothetical protein